MKVLKKWKLAILISVVLLIITGFLLTRTDHSVKGFKTYKTGRFIIYYNNVSRTSLNDMGRILLEKEKSTQTFFNIADNEKVEIIVFDSTSEFQRKTYGLLTALILPDWAVGASVKDRVFVTSPEKPHKTHTYTDILEIISHEYIHSMVWKIKPFTHVWLDEGLAVYFAGQKGTLPEELPSLETMQKDNLNAFVRADGYAFSYYYIEYLLTTFENNQIHDLLKTGDYMASLGMTMKEVYTNWANWMKHR